MDPAGVGLPADDTKSGVEYGDTIEGWFPIYNCDGEKPRRTGDVRLSIDYEPLNLESAEDE